jgi:hypothetical protein
MTKRNDNLPATVGDLRNIVRETILEASDTILQGIEKLLAVSLLEQEKRFEKKFATKEDLKREISFLRDDINGVKSDFLDVPSRIEFNKLKARVDN